MDRSPRIVMGRIEAEVVPGETARYTFLVGTGGTPPLAAEIGVSSDHAKFNPRWARVARSIDDQGLTEYLLEVPPAWDELVKGVVIFLAAMVDVYRRKYAISSSRGARTS